MSSFWDLFVGNLSFLWCPAVVSIYAFIAIILMVLGGIWLIGDWFDYGFERYHLWLFSFPILAWAAISLMTFCMQFHGGAWIPIHR